MLIVGRADNLDRIAERVGRWKMVMVIVDVWMAMMMAMMMASFFVHGVQSNRCPMLRISLTSANDFFARDDRCRWNRASVDRRKKRCMNQKIAN